MAPSPEREDFVYDFVYVDQRRIGILLSQFGTDGILTELTRSVDDNTRSAIGFDVKLLKGDTKEGSKKALGRTFDPQWLMPLLFLREAQSLIVRDVSKATMGQLVVVKGSLSVRDFSTVKFAWKSPTIKKLLLGGVAPAVAPSATGAMRRAAEEAKKDAEATVALAIEIADSMPHAAQATLTSESGSVWCTLREDGMITAPSELMLKHGVNLAGEWAIVGILDARPDSGEDDEAPSTSNNSLIGNMVSAIGPVARSMMGRPSDHYAITPLLISREISGD